jgi:hypothetical protein
MELNIPPNFDYDQLQFTRNHQTNEITYNITLVAQMLSTDTITEIDTLDTIDVWHILFALYRHHLDKGGQPNAVMEQMLKEISLTH